MSLSTMRKNFYRIATLIIDHGADAMRCLLEYFIKKNNGVSFRDFVSNQQHEIYHQYNNNICCQCPKNYRLPCKTVISVWQMDTLFDKNSPKHSNHRHSSKCEYCCSTIKPNLKLDEIDITLLRYFLVTYFEQEFWLDCLNGGVLFQDFLNTNKHDIFHLVLLKTPCCLCTENPDYKPAVATGKDISKHQLGIMFSTPNPHCNHSKICVDDKNPCSVTATTGIRPSSLDIRTRITLLSKFCVMMVHTDQLVQARNAVFAHATKGELSDKYFRKLWNDIENSILYLSQITSTDLERTRSILELREKSLEETTCLEFQKLALTKWAESVIEEIRDNTQQTLESVKALIGVKLEEILSQITKLKAKIKDLGERLSDYSDDARNMIENTRMEIRKHDADDTYVKTSAVNAATDLLRSKNLLILIGKAGIGKSSTALAIASSFHAKGIIVMKLEHKFAEDFKRYYNGKFKQLIIFDDFLGQSYVKYCSKTCKDILDVLSPHVHSGMSKFIITTRTYKIEDAADEMIKYHELFSEGVIINLNGDFNLSTTEKENILISHAIQHKINIRKKHDERQLNTKILDDIEFEKIIGTDPYLGFPEACRLFCSFDKFFAMGFEFFASPTKELKRELGKLKGTGNNVHEDALKYCVLASLMLDTVGKISNGMRKGIICHESHESLNNLLNLNCSMIEFIYKLLYSKEVKITTNDLHDICNQISENYITKDSDRKKYVFLHSTVRDAVLFSYWHESTMADIIKHCSVDILLDNVRTWDYKGEGYGTYVIVPMSKCTVLAQRLFKICLVCKGAIILSSIVIENSAHTLKLLNQKLTDWCSIKSNVINCELSKLKKFIRPAQYKNENNRPCAHANEKWLISRLIKELPKADCQVKFVRFYIQFYGCKEFIAKFNAKLTKWLRSVRNGKKCTWKILNEFVRPTRFKIENGHIGASAKDTWIIQRVINELVTVVTYGSTLHVRWYIKKYACEKFVKSFNDAFSKWLKLEGNFKKCSLKTLFELIRPTSFTIESGKLGAYTNDDFLTQRLIHELVKTRSDKFFYVKTYVKKFGSEIFVHKFNKKLTKWLQAKENMLNCEFNLLKEFVRPASFKIGSGEIRAHISDRWLIQRLFNEVQTEGVHMFSDVQSYVKKFGSDEFVTKFNQHFMEWLQSHENVMNCKLNFLYEFVRPCSFTIKNGEIGASTNDNWLTERILNVLVTSEFFSKTSDVRIYIQKFGNDNFVKDINKKLANWIQSDENVKNCELGVICNLFCPTSSKIKSGEVRAHVNDNWLSQMLLDHTIKSRSNVKYYIMKFKSNDFINNFNNKLMKWFESHENVMTCNLDVLYEFVRPSYFTIKNGEIGAITNDSWLIERIVNQLVKDEAPRFSQEQKYIKEFGNDDFIRNVNKKVTEWLQFHENVINCKLIVIIAIVRPSSFRFENREIGATTNDNWLTERLLNVFVTSNGFVISDVKNYIKKFGNDDFIIDFNKNLTEWLQSQENVINCFWEVLYFFCRPTAFRITCGEIMALVNDSWLIQHLVNDLEGTLATNVKHYIDNFGSEEFINNFNRRLTEWLQSEENIKNCGWITIEEFVRPTSFRIGNGETGAYTNDNWLIQRLISELVSPRVTFVIYVIDYIKRFGGKQFVDGFNIHLTTWLQSEEDIDKLKWDRLLKTIRPTSFKTDTGDITVPRTDSWIIQRLIYGLSKSAFEIGTVRQSVENYGSASNFISCFNDKFRAWISENTKTCEWQLFKEVVKPLSYSNSSDEISVFVDDTQVVEYLFEELHQKPDVFAIKRYIQKYGSDEFILKFNKKLNMELNDVGVIKTWERLEHFYKDRYAPILLVCSSSHHKESKRDSIKWSNRFLNYSDLDFDSDCSYDDNNDLTNWNDDSEYSTYTEDVNFDSSTDSDIEGTNDDDYDDYNRRL